MKFFPIKTTILCLLVTPFLYIITLTASEKYLDTRYLNQIQNIIIGDPEQLLDGSIRLEERISNNINRFLKEDWLIQNARLNLNIIISTAGGKIIYPIVLDDRSIDEVINTEIDSGIIAKNNFDLLNSGLLVKVKSILGHGSTIANIVLILYFGVSFFIFFIFFKMGSAKAFAEQEKRAKLITDLKKEEKIHTQILNDLRKEREGLFENIKSISAKYQEDRDKAKINEDEMFEEIVSLEEKLNSFVELKKNKELEISELKSKIQKYERRSSSKTRRIEFDFVSKRFSALYKNIEMNRKALSGFLSLSEEQQIKVEEIIHSMDQNPEKIMIKRKVFSGKKHRTACFEVLFAYNGRLYFKKNENNITEILIIGTKNTQVKDMEFLHSL